MKWHAKAVLVRLSVAAMIAGAQSSAPLPDVAILMRQAILQQRIAESKERGYVFRADTNDIRLRKECTWAPQCPGTPTRSHPAGVGFQVVDYSERHFEIFWLDGIRVARVLSSCDHCGSGKGPIEAYIRNIPISDGELAVENQRVEREVAEAKALLAQGRDASSPDDPPQILLSRMLELCIFSNPRRQVVDGRSTILLELVWNTSIKPVSTNEALLEFFSGTIGIDEEDHGVQHVEGRFLADVRLDGGNIKIRKGTRVTITNRRVDAGIWLLSRLDAWGEGRYFAFAIDGAGHIFSGSYRKFGAASRILPGYAEAPTVPPASSTPTRPISMEDRGLAQETQVRGFWTDPSTGLMWTERDTGKDVSWNKAMKYCRDLRLAGYSDWRLATLAELEGIYDKSANAPGLAGPGKGRDVTWHVKGNLFLTGNQWSGGRRNDDRGHPSGYEWYFDFNEGRSNNQPSGFPYSSSFMRALCVRGSKE